MRIVVKVGTSTLAHATGRLNIQRMERLCKVLSDLKNAGHEIILVSSGAIGMGVGKLNLSGRPADMPGKQAAAAVGQCELMYFYDKLFTEYNHIVAQLLLTGEDIRSEQRSRNVRNTLSRLLELGALPVINENDAVATDEIGVDNTIGENDSLSAIVAAADCMTATRTETRMRGSSRRCRSSTRTFSRLPETRAPRSPPAAWSRSCMPRRSQRRPAAKWSLPTVKSPRCSMTLWPAGAPAPDF